MNNYFTNYDYIGATGNFPINDYIDITSNTLNTKIDNINIINTTAITNLDNYYKRLIQYKLESGINNTYIYNCNIGGEIKFFIPVSYYDPIDNFSQQPYRVKINPLGKLYLYYNYNASISLTDTEGWYDTINLIMGSRASINTQGIAIGVIQGQIAGLVLTINNNNTAIQTSLQTIATDINDNIRPAIANATENLAIKNLTKLDLSKTQFANTLQGNFESFLSRLGNNKYISGGLGLTGFGGIIYGAIYGMIQSDHTTQIINNLTDYQINCNTNLSSIDKIDLSNNASNLLVSNILKYNCNLCNVCLYNGFINSNILTKQFIPNYWTSSSVGIGTNNPLSQIHIHTPLTNINQNLRFTNGNTGNTITDGFMISQLANGDAQIINNENANLILSTNGLEQMRIDGAGNIGIGKVPSYKLDINGNINGTEIYRGGISLTSSLANKQDNISVSAPITKTGNNLALSYDSSLTNSAGNLSVSASIVSKWSTTGTNIYNNNIGNIGIGNNAPIFKLQVGNNTSTEIIGTTIIHLANNYLDNGNYGVRLFGYDNGVNGHNLAIQTRNTATGTFNNSVIINTSGNVSMNGTLSISGNIGIGGITNPSSPLTFNNFVKNKVISLYDTGNDFQFVGLGANNGLVLSSFSSGDSFQFRVGTSSTASTEVFRISGGGNIIGTGNANQITNSTNGEVALILRNTSTGSSAYSLFGVRNDTNLFAGIFLNSSTRFNDGGLNGATLRNDAGDLRLSAKSDSPFIMLKNSSGLIGVNVLNPLTTFDIWGSSSFDSTCSLRLMNNSSQFGRTQIEMIGRYEGGNDAWNLTSGRNIIIFGYQTSQGNPTINYTNAIQSLGQSLGFINSGYSITTPAAYLDNSGNFCINTDLRLSNDRWHRSLDGKERFYFGNGGNRTYYNSGDGHEFRNNQRTTFINTAGGAVAICNDFYNNSVALRSGYMANASLTIGRTDADFGFGTGWNGNTAGLMLECLNNTEIAVHDSGTRVASLMAYQGDITNVLTIGRDMGWGTIYTVNFAGGEIAFKNEWYIYKGTSPSGVINSLIFNHWIGSINSKWWFNGTQTSTSSEISDERIKREITDITNPLELISLIKPKEYFLCAEKDYIKKFGIIAQDINKEEKLKHFIYTDEEYIANIFTKAIFKKEKIGEEEPILDPNINYEKTKDNPTPPIKPKPKEIFKYTLTSDKIINGLIESNDELKIILDNDDKENIEIIIDDTPYANRYKKRFVKVKSIIDDYSFEIYDDIEMTDIEKDNLFIYGKKVNDFLKLDYQSLYCLNIKATQELIEKNRELETALASVNARLAKLETLLGIDETK